MVRSVVVPDDLPALMGLEEVLFPDNCLGEVLLKREIEAGFAWVVGTPAYAYALVRVDGPLVDLTRLGVHPDRQGAGLGTELLVRVLGLGKETMLTVTKTNLRAVKLYLKHGFQIASHQSAAWVMRRPRDHIPWTEYSVPQAQR